jgi:hypothetical protein
MASDRGCGGRQQCEVVITMSREWGRTAMDTATQAEWGTYGDGRIKRLLAEHGVRMAKAVAEALSQTLADERRRVTAEFDVRDARITTLEEEFGAAVTQLFTEEREGMKPELTVREARM